MIEGKLQELKARANLPLTEDQLEWLERKIEGALPSSYRWMLSQYGGLSFRSVFHPDPQLNSLMQFCWFFDFEEFVDALESYSDSIPLDMIPIGDDSDGNLYCLGIHGSNRGKVFFHDHNIGWHSDADANPDIDPSEFRNQTVYELSDSLDDFVSSMVYVE